MGSSCSPLVRFFPQSSSVPEPLHCSGLFWQGMNHRQRASSRAAASSWRRAIVAYQPTLDRRKGAGGNFGSVSHLLGDNQGEQEAGCYRQSDGYTDSRSAGWMRCPQGDLRPHWTRKTVPVIISGATTPKSLPISPSPTRSPTSPGSAAPSRRASLWPSLSTAN